MKKIDWTAFTVGLGFGGIIASILMSLRSRASAPYAAASNDNKNKLYAPPAFRVTDREKLFESIRTSGLAILTFVDRAGVMRAVHLPTVIMPTLSDDDSSLVIGAHLARANQNAQELLYSSSAGPTQALLIFQLTPPHEGYVSANFYDKEAAGGRVVPTWDYTTVHARGTITMHSSEDGDGKLLQILNALTNKFEAQAIAKKPGGGGHLWKVADAPAEYVNQHMKSIVGLSFKVSSLEGADKLSQNKPVETRQRVAAGLRNSGSIAVAEAVALAI